MKFCCDRLPSWPLEAEISEMKYIWGPKPLLGSFMCKYLFNFTCYPIIFHNCHHTNQGLFRLMTFLMMHQKPIESQSSGKTESIFQLSKKWEAIFLDNFLLSLILCFFLSQKGIKTLYSLAPKLW